MQQTLSQQSGFNAAAAARMPALAQIELSAAVRH